MLAKRSRSSGYIVDAIPALSLVEEGRVGGLRRRLQSPGSALLGVGVEHVQTDDEAMCRVPEVVSEASEMLRSSSPYVLAMTEAVRRRGFDVSSS